jgi:hypothetical protein
MTSPTARLVVSGRVEFITHEGVVVVVRAGCFQRNALCPPVPGVDIGDEVVVQLDHDLRRGVIQQAPPRPPFRHQQPRRKERST